jgi:hypothetical protein
VAGVGASQSLDYNHILYYIQFVYYHFVPVNYFNKISKHYDYVIQVIIDYTHCDLCIDSLQYKKNQYITCDVFVHCYL